MTPSWQPGPSDPRIPARSRSGQLLGRDLPHGIYYRPNDDGSLEGIAVIDGHVVSRWTELPFPGALPLCSPWNRVLADQSAIGLAVDSALRCHADNPEPLHPNKFERAVWAVQAVLEGQLAYAEVSTTPEQMLALVAKIHASPLILAHHSERTHDSLLPTLRVGRSERISDLWDVPALIRAWEQIDVPDEVAKAERKALDEAQDLRVSDVVYRPAQLGRASWAVLALIVGDSPGWAAWESVQEWRREHHDPVATLVDGAR